MSRVWMTTALGAALLSTALVAAPAQALVPKTAAIEGFLTSSGGGAAADGTYDMTFNVYANSSTTTALWTEGPAQVTVSKGQFSWTLGSKTAIDVAKIAAAASPFLGIKIGSDPELPRRALHSTIFAMHAGSADTLTCTGCVSATQIAGGGISAAKVGFNYAGSTTKGGPAVDLACTGCVSVKELKFDGDVDLAGNSLKAKNGTFSGDVAAATITAGAFIGDGSKLTGIKTPSGECKTAGEVVKGINTDGSLKCVKAMDPAALPKDGLNEISNDLLSNQFIDTISTKDTKVAIPDFQGKEAISNITFPNIGTAQTFSVSVHVENTDLSLLSMVVLPPNDKKVGWKLCDPCGAKDSKIYKASFTPTAKPASGDIGYWIGKNPQGLWNLKVLDNAFCILQASGNAKYCDPVKKTDGWIETWSITIQTLSNQKVAMNGNLLVSGSVKVGNDSVACTSLNVGAIRWDKTSKAFMGCDGTRWATLNNDIGRSKETAGRTCLDIKTRNPQATDGKYWIDPDGTGKDVPYVAYCDQTRDGGGWTLGMKHWYQDYIYSPMGGNRVGGWGSLDTVHTVKDYAYKMSDVRIRNVIGAKENFDVMFDQNGVNTSYSYQNIEYIIMRNYTGYWRFDLRMPESKTKKTIESWHHDGTLLWTGDMACGSTHSGGRGINCYNVSNGAKSPQGGQACAKNDSRNNWASVPHLYMYEHNSDSYIYICNGAQHTSGHHMSHRYWFRERN